ncbi:hypothetical protein EAE96_004973 [Botrytis aclada]|nr:hypothetical protein EAE96_004973 [Botrytis aclada]
MGPRGNRRRRNECELDHECDQEIKGAMQQQVLQEAIRRTNLEKNNRSGVVRGLDETEPRGSNGDEGGHGSSQMNTQEMNRHHRGYTWPFNLRVLEWRNRHLEEWIMKLLDKYTTLLPKDAGILRLWSMVTPKVAGKTCFFVLDCSHTPSNTIRVVCINADEYQERCVRWIQSTESPQEKALTHELL